MQCHYLLSPTTVESARELSKGLSRFKEPEVGVKENQNTLDSSVKTKLCDCKGDSKRARGSIEQQEDEGMHPSEIMFSQTQE